MDIDLNKIKNHSPGLIGEENFFKAAVCICLLEKNGTYEVLLETRSEKIPDQPGDVCLPGGAVEENESFLDAAVRETCEELLIRPEQLTIIGTCDVFHSGNTLICPYAGLLKDYKGTFEPKEVAEVFSVPLDFFLNTEPERYAVDAVITPQEDFPFDLIKGGRNYKWRSRRTSELFYQYEGHVIWGITARILHAFCRLL